MSLATRLSAFFLATLALVLGGFSATLYLLARTHFLRDIDERLMVALDALSATAEVDEGEVRWRPGTRLPMADVHSGEDTVRWAVYNGRGTLVDRSWNAEREDFSGVLGHVPNVGHAHLSMAGRDDHRWRMAVRRLQAGPDADADDHDSTLILATGTPLAPMEASLRNAAWLLLGLSSGLWLLAATAGRRLSHRALRPVSRMARAAGAMSATDRDQRLPSPGTGDELEDLAHSFNGLLGRLHEAFARQERFTSEASHQLRTPLTALISEIEVARRRERTAEDHQHILDQIHGDAVRLRQIVEALLFLARADAEAELPDLEPIDLTAWLPRHLRHWSGHPRTADLQENEARDAPQWVRVHPPLLGQLLDNLLDNACKYSEPGTPIRILLGREPGVVALAVEDRGHGLSAEDLPHVFEPFYRAPQARLRGAPGIGLGLAIVHRIAATFGGRVSVESAPGQGSRFTVRLPEVKAPSTARTHSELLGPISAVPVGG
jgi:two-component system, OmpR family, sensor kinase